MNIINIYTLKFPNNRHFLEPILTGLRFFAAENRFNIEMLQYKLPLIVIVAPSKLYSE